jgi:hypothetical protein
MHLFLKSLIPTDPAALSCGNSATSQQVATTGDDLQFWSVDKFCDMKLKKKYVKTAMIYASYSNTFFNRNVN